MSPDNWEVARRQQMQQLGRNNLVNVPSQVLTYREMNANINAMAAPPINMAQNPKFNPGDYVKLKKDKTNTEWRIYESTDTYRQDPNRAAINLPRFIYILAQEVNGAVTLADDMPIAEEDLTMAITEEAKIPEKKKAKVSFDSVIIEPEKREQILEALEQVHQADLIFETWGFGETIEKGKGVSMLFYGPPGTGKTLMAQAIAHKLDYELKIISTADVESSAPGEAERNIRKHFKDANEAKKGAILLFDECDSLIYTRANVGPIMSAQINELLSQIEKFDGITLFTTNRLGTLDEALNRRLALKLEFAMPTQEQRAQIWQRMFPKACPLDKDIDWMKLAIVEVSGGYIKNTVLRAARMAATEKIPDKKKKIRQEHLIKALRLETASMIEFENAREAHNAGFMPVNGATHQGGKVKVRG